MTKQLSIPTLILLLLSLTIKSFGFGHEGLDCPDNDTNDASSLPALQITGNYIMPDDGIDSSEAANLIIRKLKKSGAKGPISSHIILKEITTNVVWKNIGVQLYRFNRGFPDEIAIIKNETVLTILNGMPIESVFLADLDKDGKYEIYANIFWGSGIISREVLGYNIATNASYHLAMRAKKDLVLFIEQGELLSKVLPYYPGRYAEEVSVAKVILKHDNQQTVLDVKEK